MPIAHALSPLEGPATGPSLNGLLAELHAERVRSWDPAKLQVNIDQRRELVAAFDPSRAVRVGDGIAPFTLRDIAGGDIMRDELLAAGPAVLVFFRFAGCPACNIALPYYQRQIWPARVSRWSRSARRCRNGWSRSSAAMRWISASHPIPTMRSRAGWGWRSRPMRRPVPGARGRAGSARLSARTAGNCRNPR